MGVRIIIGLIPEWGGRDLKVLLTVMDMSVERDVRRVMGGFLMSSDDGPAGGRVGWAGDRMFRVQARVRALLTGGDNCQ